MEKAGEVSIGFPGLWGGSQPAPTCVRSYRPDPQAAACKCTGGLLPGDAWEMGAFACLSVLSAVVIGAAVLTQLLKLLVFCCGLGDASLMTFTDRCFGVLSLEW